MKSIKDRIILLLTTSIALVCVILGGVGSVLNYRTSMSMLEETLQDTAKAAAAQVAASMQANLNVARETGGIARLSNSAVSRAEKTELIQQRVETYGFVSGGILDQYGRGVVGPVSNAAGEDYFQAALRGETFVTDPAPNSEGTLTMLLVAPLWQDGVTGGTAAGAVYFIPEPLFLSHLVDQISVGENGAAYILDGKGTTIGYYDEDIVLSQYNTQVEVLNDPALRPLAELEARMMKGETGFGKYYFNGVDSILAFAPVPDSSGWSVSVSAGQQEFLGGVYQAILMTILVAAAFILLGVWTAFRFGKKIGGPMLACADRLELLAHGDLKSPVPQVEGKDETARLAKATATIAETMDKIIEDIELGLGGIATGDFTVDSQQKHLYVGDFTKIAASLYQILDGLSETVSQVRDTAHQVSVGSGQVSDGAQVLARGAAQQASATQQLASAIGEISGQVQENAAGAMDASRIAGDVERRMTESNQKMQELVQAMEEITVSSDQIGKIIATIENIAFQTNILALNAAVEAARAGTAGKGFAVVADEVRSLAAKSAEASKNTGELIGRSIRAVEHGKTIVDSTAQSLLGAVDGAQQVADVIGKISRASEQQAETIQQVSQGVDQIASVVQTNSATAQESAAASEELSSQAEVLRQLVSRFKLREGQ